MLAVIEEIYRTRHCYGRALGGFGEDASGWLTFTSANAAREKSFLV